MSSINTINIDDWVIRQKIPQGKGPFPVVMMLHGWTGDENAMWVFASRMPPKALLLAPRGLYKTPMGGYGWHKHMVNSWPWVDDFQPAIDALVELLHHGNFPYADLSQISLVGFSQGAAMGYTLALQYSSFVSQISGLSGFLPQGAAALARNRPLLHKQVFVAHGTQDDLVPVQRARQAVEVLQEAGATVTYCEDQVGHKLSANCYRGLEYFVNQTGDRS